MATLASFIKFLDGNGLIRFANCTDGDDMKGFGELVKIQKYAYLAKMFGLDLPYVHDIYAYGPYSNAIGDDCWDLADNVAEYERAEDGLDASFDAAGFLGVVGPRDQQWMEIATTLIKQSERYPDRTDVVDSVFSFKEEHGREYIANVLSEIEELKLIRLAA